MKEAVYEGCNLQWSFTNSIVLKFKSCRGKFLLLGNPWVIFPSVLPTYLFLQFIFTFFLSPFSLCITPYFSFHRNFLLGGGRQGICCIQSRFLPITVFLTFMISKDTFKTWQKKRTRQWHQYSFWHSKEKKKKKWNSTAWTFMPKIIITTACSVLIIFSSPWMARQINTILWNVYFFLI